MRLRGALPLAFFLVLAPALYAEAPVKVTATPTTVEGSASLLVRAFSGKFELRGLAGGAEVSIDRRVQGYAPHAAASLTPGSYLIGVAAPGYRSREFSLTLDEKMNYEVAFSLEEARGFVFVETSPPDAEVLVGGVAHKSGLIEVPAGLRELRVRRFGFVEGRVMVPVVDRETTRVRVELEPATFAVSAFSANRPTFNPGNAGPFGQVVFSFSVTSFGSGELEVVDENGRRVFAAAFPSFTSWNQSLVWKGLDEKGQPLPDGYYEARLTTRAATKNPASASAPGGAPLLLTITIDSTIVARPYGSQGGLAGLVFLPETDPAPASLGTLDLQGAWEASQSRALLSLTGSWSSGGFIVGFDIGSRFASADSANASLDLGLVYPLGLDAPIGLALAGALNAGVEASGGTTLGGLLLAPLALDREIEGRADRLRASLGIAPGFLVAWSPGASVGLGVELRGGLSLAATGWRLGLSGRSSLVGLERFQLSWTGAEFALEGRVALAPSPLILTGSLAAGIDAAGKPGALRLGAGLGLWF